MVRQCRSLDVNSWPRAAATAGFSALGYSAAHADLGLPPSQAAGTSHGTLLDYSRRCHPDGHPARPATWAWCYVSDRRPGAEFMKANAVDRTGIGGHASHGLAVVSCYQYGKGKTADWLGGFDAGVQHAKRGLELHNLAGGR